MGNNSLDWNLFSEVWRTNSPDTYESLNQTAIGLPVEEVINDLKNNFPHVYANVVSEYKKRLKDV